jgi:hypothetical protein
MPKAESEFNRTSLTDPTPPIANNQPPEIEFSGSAPFFSFLLLFHVAFHTQTTQVKVKADHGN